MMSDPRLWPSPVDSLERRPDDPQGFHMRRVLSNGCPIMGSSPAERQERRSALMRDHLFEGDGTHCMAWIGGRPQGSDETGYISMRVGCGYPPDLHPN